MSTPQAPKRPEVGHFQAMLISTASQKRREAIERRMVIEDVLE